MNPTYNNRVYAVIPIAKTTLCVESNIEHGRKSLNGNFLIWDEDWKPATLESMKQDHDIKLLTHEQALNLMSTDKWRGEELSEI